MKYLVFTSFLVLIGMLVGCSKVAEKTPESTAVSDTILQKDGTVLTYAKPQNDLIVMKRDKTAYSEAYQDRLRKISELYLDKTNRELVNYHKNRPESQLGFSMEENDWEGVNYTQIGIFTRSETNISTLQWLFYEPASQKLYEFDLNKKNLTEFPLK